MKIACVQLTTGEKVEDNLNLVIPRIREAAQNGARIIVCPEATSQAFSAGRLDTQAEDLEGTFATRLQELAQELEVLIVAGTFRPADQHEVDGKTLNRVFNTALITGLGHHEGYDKIHTYDAFDYRESDTVRPGEDYVVVDVDGLKVGVAICYDIRFPEQFKELARRGAELIVVPTSWADGDGKLNAWRTLSTARALDSVSYIAAAGQARPGGNAKAGEASGPTGIGHSVIVDPNGQRLAEAGYEDEIVYATIDQDAVQEARKKLPILDWTGA
ncbi:carbon-nitrogen hydrolase family protein [Corynebacterium tapiri]|uniref:Carbon-nitrogen hydrolase family protein n=1 Tax=Corynebacterium tapiri TaxID=1448266 RepID=A0A5C4U1Q5_9CORY|nr:carbon-nitrogen hydrolase family protein [Corynebacterium tapiri]TNL95719.1 carbon-nitrogen hydrolase family protein [Corynebacterium tapiri]